MRRRAREETADRVVVTGTARQGSFAPAYTVAALELARHVLELILTGADS